MRDTGNEVVHRVDLQTSLYVKRAYPSVGGRRNLVPSVSHPGDGEMRDPGNEVGVGGR